MNTCYIYIIDTENKKVLFGLEHTRNIFKNLGGKWDLYDGLEDHTHFPKHYNTCAREFIEEIYGVSEKNIRDEIKQHRKLPLRIRNNMIEPMKEYRSVIRDLYKSEVPSLIKNLPKKVIDKNIRNLHIQNTIYFVTKTELDQIIKKIPINVHRYFNKFNSIFTQKPTNFNYIISNRGYIKDAEIADFCVFNIKDLVDLCIDTIKKTPSDEQMDFFEYVSKEFVEDETNLYVKSVRPKIMKIVSSFLIFQNKYISENKINTVSDKKIVAEFSNYFNYDLTNIVEFIISTQIK